MARIHLEQTLAENPNYGFAIGGMAELESMSGNNEKALELYQKALNIIPEFSFQEEIARIYVEI